MRPATVLLPALCFVGILGSSAAGQEEASPRDALVEGMTWRSIGPSRGGRCTAVAGVRGQPLVHYMGSTGGGVWKTEDGGQSWSPVTDGFLGTGSVGALAVAESDPNVVYVGMGEACVRGNFSHGDGVYRSLDAGRTWQHMGLADSRQIGRILVHPRDPDLVYVAALGHVFGPNEERGVFRSRDGGASFERVLYVDDQTGAVDLAMDPRNPRHLYAAFWQVRRTPWSLESGGTGSGLYRSTDGGDSWTRLEGGLPTGVVGRIGVTVSPADPDRVWAIVEAEEGGVFRSEDGGVRWRRVNEDRDLRQRAWYYTHIQADPKEANTVYVLNVGFHRSLDGGATYETLRAPHGDHHALWIDPDDNRHLINGNDGGANVSFDGGRSWSRQDNQPTAQFYHVITDSRFPYRVYGAQQDNSTVSISSQGGGRRGGEDFHAVGGGESGYIAPHPEDPDIVYAGSYDGLLTRYDHRTGLTRDITVWPDNPMGWGAGPLKYRFQWTFPILVSRHDPSVLYTAGNVVFRSRDEGASWEAISPDLTTDDKSKQGPSGGPITKDNTSVEYYCTVFTLAESPHDPAVLWAGSDDGLVHVTRDGAGTWTDVTPLDLPKWSRVSMVEPSPHVPGAAYLAVNRYQSDDFRPYVFKTDDFGATWSSVVDGLPRNAFVRSVREDPARRGLLYAGTETGVHVSFDDGAHWRPLQNNLPVVPITDLVVKDHDLVVATQGRSFWILDDLTPLHQVAAAAPDGGPLLLDPRDAVRTRGAEVRVRYHLPSEPEEFRLEFLDSSGERIRSFGRARGNDAPEAGAGRGRFGGGSPTGASASPGWNLFSWNLQYPDAVAVPGAVLWGGSTRGPTAPPGRYRVRLQVDDVTREQEFEVLPDPRLDLTPEDYAAQFALLLDLRDRLSDAHRAVNTVRSIRSQADAVVQHAKDLEAGPALREAAEGLGRKLTRIEEALIQVRSRSSQDPLNFPIQLNNKLAALAGTVAGSFGPTAQARGVFQELSARLQVQLDLLEEVLTVDVPAFNEAVAQHQVPAIVLEPEPAAEEALGPSRGTARRWF